MQALLGALTQLLAHRLELLARTRELLVRRLELLHGRLQLLIRSLELAPCMLESLLERPVAEIVHAAPVPTPAREKRPWRVACAT